MTDTLQPSVFASQDSPQGSPSVTEADVLITEVLASRPARPPNLVAENEALRTLAESLLDDPQSLLKTLVNLTIDLCQADTVGVSLLETPPEGTSVFRWVAIGGALKALEQTTIPANFSPCGTTLDSNQPQLYRYPEGYFTYLYHPQFPIAEGLLIPLCIRDRPLGTLWIVSHDATRHFDAEDRRLMMSLGSFTAAALDKIQQAQERQQAEERLRESEKRLSAIFSQALVGLSEISLDGYFLRVNDELCRLLGRSREEMLTARVADVTHPDDIPKSLKALEKLVETGEPAVLHKRYLDSKGTIVWAKSSLSRLDNDRGHPQTVLAVTVDLTDRQQAEEDLRASEERYRAIVNQVLTGVAYAELDGTLTLVNQKYCEITGYSPEELSQIRIHDITHPDDWSRNVELYNRMLAEGTPFEIEKRYIRKDGSIVWVNNSVSAICDREGKPQSAVAIVLDITQRKQAEAALRASEQERNKQLEIFDTVLASLQEFVYLLDRDGRFQYVNKPLLDLWGLTLDQAIGKTFFDLNYPDKLAGTLQAQIQQVIDTAQPVEGETAYTSPTGVTGHYEYTFVPIFDRDGSVEAVGGQTRVVTERRLAEAALRASEAKYRTLFNSIDEGFNVIEMIFDDTGKPIDYQIIENNPAQEKLTGLRDSVGKRIRALIPNIEDYGIEELGQVAVTGKPIRFENRVQALDRWFDIYASRIGSEGSRTIALIFNDITDRKRREANAAFLAEIAADFSRLSTPDEIVQTVGAKVGAFLHLPYCYFISVDEARDEVVFLDRWNADNVPPLPDTVCLSEQVNEDFYCLVHAGETVVSNDTQANPITNAAANATLQARAFITVPFHQEGEWKYLFCVHDIRPRQWRADEIELVRELANRMFPCLERARAEEALRASEAKYRSLFDSIDEGFCIVQLIFDKTDRPIDFRYLEINPVFEQQTGMKNALGRTIRELVPDIESFWFDRYGTVALTGEPMRFINQSESMGRWFDVYAFRIGEPDERKVAVLFNDISDRKQTEVEREQLLANERNNANQLQGLTSAALAINSALSVEDVLEVITKQAAFIIGAHQSVTSLTIDRNWTQAINTVYLSDKYAQWRDYDEGTDGSGIYAYACHLNRPLRMTQAELETHPLWKGFGKAADRHPPMRGWLVAPLVGREGHNIGLIQLSDKYEGDFTPSDESILVQLAQMASVALENARLYKAEQQARSGAEAAREEAQAANRVKDEFLAVLSHELRSPLNPILGWSRLLQSGKLDKAKTIQALATIERNAKLQAELIEDLLDVSRILRGTLSLNVAPVNLTSVIRAAMETTRLAADAKSIQVEAHLTPDVGVVWGDTTRLQQVIWNLLSNAVKFTSTGGWVNIRLEHLESYAQITVSDNGQGIDPDFLPYVFDYFRQANATTTRRFGGLGLGLAIVRHLVELHGGTIRVESQGEGQGAIFVVQLPLRRTPLPADLNPQVTEESPDLQDIKILLVDDDTDTRDFVAFLLEQQGAQVTSVTSAHEALLIFSQLKPDLLLSDIGMPDVDGYMLIRQVRRLAPEEGGQIPAIALTAYAGSINQRQAIEAGFHQHISKPIEPEVLIQTIVSLIHPI